ncbi:hypothetical protein H5410_046038 [Solanum commersonii]|uniref:Uncharacterized protein n=1 Tax=Solanum commersonii TaxID=4109 RepID=A0A9J5XEF2_SOLCO|nr:hypothetical protein H5410_046038 [Solanum commersonii]
MVDVFELCGGVGVKYTRVLGLGRETTDWRQRRDLPEHLDTHPIQNSNLEGNINPNKVAGDVPLAPSAQNISKVGKQHPKEEEYLSFTRYIYNLPEENGETYGVLGTTSLFPRISIFPNGLPSFTAQLFEFGYLDRVYTKPDLKELSQLPSKLFEAVKNYAQGNGVYCRFFSISMECKDMQAYYPTLNYITIEKIKDFNVKATGVDKKLPHLNKKWIQTRRALGIKALYAILKRLYNEDSRVIEQDHDWVLITKGRSKSSELKERILDIELHRLGATEETWKLACKMLDHNHP